MKRPQETWVRSLGWEDPLEGEMAIPSGILAWRIPWAEEPGGPQSQMRFSDLILCRRLLCDSHCGWRWPWDQTTQAACRDGRGLRGEEGLDSAGFWVRARAGRWEPHKARYSRISRLFSQLQPSQTPAALRGGRSCWVSAYWALPEPAVFLPENPMSEEPGGLQFMGLQNIQTWLSD